MKNCKNCNQLKSLSMFTKSPSNKDGYMTICKPCKVEINRAYGRTPKGRITFSFGQQVRSSKQRGHSPPTYTIKTLFDWALQNNLEDLVEQWQQTGYAKDMAPSIDRIDDHKGYSLDNIQLVTWAENRDKLYVTRKAGTRITSQNRPVNQLALDGTFIQEFPSVALASRATGIQRTNINAYCLKRSSSKHVGGYLWEYA